MEINNTDKNITEQDVQRETSPEEVTREETKSSENTKKEKKTKKEKQKKDKKNNEVSFFKGLSAEWKKISWGKRELIIKETGLVFIVSIVLGAFITGIDSAVLYLFSLFV